MTDTTNLAITLVPTGTLEPSVPVNAALSQLDAAVAGTLSIEFAADVNLTLTEAQYQQSALIFTDSPTTLTTGRDVVFPAHFPVMYVKNSTAQTLTLKKTGQTGVTLSAGSASIFASGATDVVSGAGSFTGGALTSALNEAKGADIASAATTNIGAATGNFVHVTGTTTITALGTVQAGTRRVVTFDGALTLTHNATSLILPTGANITTAAGDCAEFVSEGSGNWRCTGYERANGQALSGGGGGGLTNFTDTLNSSSPNATVTVAELKGANAATNGDLAVTPKGTGALLRKTPDNTTTGGDKRGTRATDWQAIRTASTQVASGTEATISGGQNNTASGANSVVGGGTTNTANGTNCTVGGGNSNQAQGTAGTVAGGNSNNASGSSQATVAGGGSNTASGDQSAVGGGGSNTASGSGSVVAGGNSNTASGANAFIPGGIWGNTRGLTGAGARASGRFAASGDCQDMTMVLRANTTNNTQTTLTADQAAASTTNQLVLPNTSSYVVKAIATARENATGDSRSWEVTAHIKRGANAAATAMVAAATVTSIANDAGAAAWALAVDADTTNGCLRVRGTGETSKDIKWGFDIFACIQVVG